MFKAENKLRESVKKLIPYSCARDEFQGSKEIFLDANENPYGNLNRYPDPYQRDLKKMISRVKGIDDSRIFIGNGSDEIIDLCYRIFCNPGSDSALTFTPTYGMYEVSASINDVNLIKLPLNEDFQIDIDTFKTYISNKKLKLIFICSPNNPTGNSFNNDTIEYILKNFEGIVAIDEAYIDFSERESWINRLPEFPNLIVMQTLSKAYGLAGARIGLAFADNELLEYFNKMKPPYNVSKLNQEAALKRLQKRELFSGEVKRIKSEKERMIKELNELSITEKVYPSDANFVLVRVSDASFTYKYLVNNGIIVRNRSSVVNNSLRITIGKRSENNSLLNALRNMPK